MKKFKQNLSLVMAATLLLAVTACNNGDTTEGSTSASKSEETQKQTETEASTEAASDGITGAIHVYTRDESSGTRGAFQEIVGFGDAEKKQDPLSAKASTVDSNGDMAKSVGQDDHAIGYVSLTTDFEANNIRAVAYEGVEPSTETVLDGSYALKRPFNLVSRKKGDFADDKTEQLVDAFVDYLINSKEGRAAVESAGGIVDVNAGTPWAELAEKHPIVNEDNSALNIRTAGSTSVEKTLQAALESFQPLAGNFQFTMNQTGSGDGFKRVLGDEKDSANAADLGFASREFKEEETVADGMVSGPFAQDAVVVVVESSNSIKDLTNDQVKAIFTGKTENWEDLSK